MNIIAISDLHGYLPDNLPEGDCLVIAGDVLPDLRPTVKQAEWALDVLAPWLRAQTERFRNIILTWGNHDYVDAYGTPVAANLNDAVNDFTDGPPKSFVYICDSPQTVKLGKYWFYVNPYCLQLPGWAYQTHEDCLADMYRDIPVGVDVIVSHGPPMDYCDKIEKSMGGFHAGSISLKRAVRKIQPQVVICGHIHEAFGQYTLHHTGGTTPTKIYNVAQMDINYHYKHRPVEIAL